MTGTTKVIIMLVVWLLYALVAYFGCLQECCGIDPRDEALTEQTDQKAVDESDLTINRYALAAKWSDLDLYTNEEFGAFKKRILDGKTDNNILEITGYHYEGETKPEGFGNGGLARANAIWKTHFPDLPEDRVKIRARTRTVTDTTGTQRGFFEAAAFKWEEVEETVAETVEELDDRIIIRFPFGSVEREYDPKVDEYLKKLAERVKQTGEKITLTGHTDDVGTDAINLELGQSRAVGIESILTDYGVPASQVETSSKGESQPVASNKTEEGRYENRRCEVRLIKKASN